MRQLNSGDKTFSGQLSLLLNRSESDKQQVDDTVAQIVERVRKEGDSALLELTNHFDRRQASDPANLELSQSVLKEFRDGLDNQTRDGLEQAHERIRDFHQRQCEKDWSFKDACGSEFGQIINPLERVGVYVPGGKAAYPSSVLMNVTPARVAGVNEIIMVVPAPDGVLNPIVMAAASIAEVDRVFTIGGAQAVAALAYGTELVPGVDKIVGPGNIFVATAKKQVFGQVGIDMIAGPSEVAIICDEGANPDWIAMDLFAQAEHDEMAQSILISPYGAMLDKVMTSIDSLLPGMERREIIQQALTDQGAMIKVKDMQEALSVVNIIAPEHLELMVEDPNPLLREVRNAGAIFAGYYSAESLGDYCAGPNHVLPTSGTARFSSPLGVYDFQKRSSVIMCSQQGASNLSKVASVLARAEGLTAHARSAEYRQLHNTDLVNN